MSPMEAYPEPPQISKMESFATARNLSTIDAKLFILNIGGGPGSAVAKGWRFLKKNSQNHSRNFVQLYVSSSTKYANQCLVSTKRSHTFKPFMFILLN